MDTQGAPRIVSSNGGMMTAEDALTAGLRMGAVYKTVGLTSDADPCSVAIRKAFAAGVNASGSDVVYTGECPVPAAIQALRNRCQCIAAVGCPTVSGMPSISFYRNDGSTFTDVDLRILEGDPGDLPEWSDIGRILTVVTAADEYAESISRSGLNINGYVAMDCGCGCTASVAPAALGSLGAYVSTINADSRTTKPRNPGVTKTDLILLSRFVDASVGSIGIAYNGDGTRMSAYSEDGQFIEYDKLLALFLRYYEPRVAVIPFNSPAVVEDAFWQPYGMRASGHGSEEGRKILRGTDDEHIFELCRDNNADFAALGDGRFIFPETSLCPDAILASAVLTELSGIRALRVLLNELPQYITKHVVMEYSGTPHMFNKKFVEAISKFKTKEFADEKTAWKVIMDEGMYTVMLRDGKIDVDAVADDQIYLVTMLDEAVSIIRSCL